MYENWTRPETSGSFLTKILKSSELRKGFLGSIIPAWMSVATFSLVEAQMESAIVPTVVDTNSTRQSLALPVHRHLISSSTSSSRPHHFLQRAENLTVRRPWVYKMWKNGAERFLAEIIFMYEYYSFATCQLNADRYHYSDSSLNTAC